VEVVVAEVAEVAEAEVEVAEVAEAEVVAEAEAAEAEAEAEAAFRRTGPELRSASRSQSIQNPPRIGSSQLQARSLLWP
jgi:hypothetical protein